MNILALDLGTRTGWALSYRGVVEHGVETFAPIRHESQGMRWLKFERWFETMLDMHPLIKLVAFERWISTRMGTASEITAGFTTRVVEYCDRYTPPLMYVAVSPSELKRFTTGKGNANKHAMVDAVERRWKRHIEDENEADAYALLQFAIETYASKGGANRDHVRDANSTQGERR